MFLLVRDPREAIASFVIHANRNIDRSIDEYIAYYKPLIGVAHQMFVARFEDVIQDFPKVIKAFSSRFDLNLNIPQFDTNFLQLVHDGVRSFPWGRNLRQLSLPSPERAALLAEVRIALAHQSYQRHLARARMVYDEIVTRSNQ